MDPETIASVVESEDADAVNDLLDDLDSLDVDEQFEYFDAYYEPLLESMERADGYGRQAVVRIVTTLDPGMYRLALEHSDPDRFEHPPDEEAITDAVDRAMALYVAALEDEDGRVRRAAVRGLHSLAVNCRLVGDRDALERLLADLDDLASRIDDERREHVAEAREDALAQLR